MIGVFTIVSPLSTKMPHLLKEKTIKFRNNRIIGGYNHSFQLMLRAAADIYSFERWFFFVIRLHFQSKSRIIVAKICHMILFIHDSHFTSLFLCLSSIQIRNNRRDCFRSKCTVNVMWQTNESSTLSPQWLIPSFIGWIFFSGKFLIFGQAFGSFPRCRISFKNQIWILVSVSCRMRYYNDYYYYWSIFWNIICCRRIVHNLQSLLHIDGHAFSATCG